MAGLMPLGSYLAFVAACTALMLLPGPNVALIVGTSMAHGRRAGLATVAGTTAATAVGLAVAAGGLSAAVLAAGHLFEVLRWAGVAYLLVLGVRALASHGEALAVTAAAPTPWRALRRGFAVSLTNPKTLLFFGAFLPQFVDRGGDATLQLLALSVTALLIAACVDAGWAVLAHKARGVIGMRPAWRSRLSGMCMLGAAAGLALAREGL